jgi:two-component system NtrC family sensor kinase
MSNTLDLPAGDEDILFAEDDDATPTPLGIWETLIVDDDVEVHSVTKLALEDFVFDEKRLEFISAHSAREAREKITAHPNTAVILLDVVMEADDAGLRFVKELRGDIGNKLVRVILRTGQPGQAPERRIIVDYDINDYKTKPELTSQKLFTSMVAALRSFRDLTTLERAKAELADLNLSLERRVDERTADLADANRELRETQTQLVQASKMASLGSLVAGVAHEINTPIASVSSSQATLRLAIKRIRAALEKAGDAEPKVMSYMAIVEDSSEVIEVGAARVAQIVERLRRFARLDEAALQHVSVNECVRDALDLAGHSLSHVEVSSQLDEVPDLTCYPNRINHVLFNLLTNAAEAMDDGGRLRVHVAQDGDHIEISVADSGPGITAENQRHIFDPGFTTKMRGVGSGLGLAIAYQVVGDHGGTITVDSTPGEGATFAIRLPLRSPLR